MRATTKLVVSSLTNGALRSPNNFFERSVTLMSKLGFLPRLQKPSNAKRMEMFLSVSMAVKQGFSPTSIVLLAVDKVREFEDERGLNLHTLIDAVESHDADSTWVELWNALRRTDNSRGLPTCGAQIVGDARTESGTMCVAHIIFTYPQINLPMVNKIRFDLDTFDGETIVDRNGWVCAVTNSQLENARTRRNQNV